MVWQEASAAAVVVCFNVRVRNTTMMNDGSLLTVDLRLAVVLYGLLKLQNGACSRERIRLQGGVDGWMQVIDDPMKRSAEDELKGGGRRKRHMTSSCKSLMGC